jgi:hypothetical protein
MPTATGPATEAAVQARDVVAAFEGGETHWRIGGSVLTQQNFDTQLFFIVKSCVEPFMFIFLVY